MILAFLPVIRSEIISASRRGLTKYRSNGFSNIFQCLSESKNPPKILKQIFVGQKQSIRTISTQTKLTQKKQGEKDEHCTPQNSFPQSESTNVSTNQLTRRQKLQKAVKEYGSTVMVFHVTISLMSLGTFYLAVSRYHLFLLVFFMLF